jgi:hypothetical protein
MKAAPPELRVSANATDSTTTLLAGRITPVQTDSIYICDSCGEEIVIPVDLSAGESQEYVEDCPVCFTSHFDVCVILS